MNLRGILQNRGVLLSKKVMLLKQGRAASMISKAASNKAQFTVHPQDRSKLKEAVPVSVTVQFNPSGYGYQRTATWNEGSEGQKTKELHFDKVERRQMAVDLIFDAMSADVKDVRLLTSPLESYARPIVEASSASERRRPPRVQFVWGGFTMMCVLTSVNISFTLFSESGVPVRAKVQVAMQEYVNPLEVVKSGGAGDPETTYIVRHGDTLLAVSANVLGDQNLWRVLAKENNVDNPFVLAPGTVLHIPALETYTG